MMFISQNCIYCERNIDMTRNTINSLLMAFYYSCKM